MGGFFPFFQEKPAKTAGFCGVLAAPGGSRQAALPAPAGEGWMGYCATVSQNRIRIVAIWARVAVPAGWRLSSSKPWRRPSATAQERAWVA